MAAKSPAIYINLPVTSLDHAIAFYSAIGFVQNKFCTDTGTTMMALPPLTNGVGTINVMLHTHDKFQSFLPEGKVIADAKKDTEVLLCLSCESKGGVDEWVERAVKAGGKRAKKGTSEAMHWASFEDLDHHVWEVVWMNEEAWGQSS